MNTTFEPQAYGRYFLVDTIAVGGMAEVFKAKTFSEGGFEKLLCIKRILQHLSGNDEFVEMFIDEAKISVELQHPNIVPIYDFGKIRDNYFIAMECVEGKDVKGILRKLAERRKLLPPEYAAYIAHETCKGLDYAHKKKSLRGEPLGIIHRDISPSNILVSYNGEVKIADFGIAKARISAYNTKDGVLKGKFEYMSPEQAAGEGVSPKSDIFCTGIILHEMLTGRRLFKTDSDVKTLEKIKAVDIDPPSQVNPSVPARLDALVMRALSRDPSDRFVDAREMQTALMEYLYPSSPDITRESIDRFMHELFISEIDTERMRLDEGSKVAVGMYDSGPELDLEGDWLEESPGSAHTMQTEPSRNITWMVVGVLVLLAAVVVLLMSGSLQSDPSGEVSSAPTSSSSPSKAVEEPATSPSRDREPPESSEGLPADGAVLSPQGEDSDPIQEAESGAVDPDASRTESRKKARSKAASDTPPSEDAESSRREEESVRDGDIGTVAVAKGKVLILFDEDIPRHQVTLYVDGKEVSPTPSRLELPVGSHAIRAKYDDASLDMTKSIKVVAGEQAEVRF